MTLTRFRSLAASYGSDLSRWPEEERGEAEILLQASDQARLYIEDARTLDELISQYQQPDSATDEVNRRATDLAKLRAAVAVRISHPRHGVQHRGDGGPAALFGFLRKSNPHFLGAIGLAAGGGLAIAAGLLIGWIYTSQPRSGDLLSALEGAPSRMFAE